MGYNEHNSGFNEVNVAMPFKLLALLHGNVLVRTPYFSNLYFTKNLIDYIDVNTLIW